MTRVNDLLASWMAKNNRDDFTTRTKRIIASKVGFRCSNPSCRKSTLSPNSNNDDFLTLGDAAHISAASEGGPRYNCNMTHDQRKHESNGIWLCKDCAYIVDHDHEEAYSTQTLLNFKTWSEKKAKSESRFKEDGIEKITNELDKLINELNFFINEYQLNDPPNEYLKDPVNHIKYQIDPNCRQKYNKLKEEYSSQMLDKYEKSILPLLVGTLHKCRILLGESDEKVRYVYGEKDITTISIEELKEIRRILYELKAEVEWR